MGVLGVGTGPSNVAILAQMELNRIPASDRGAECRSDFVGFLKAVENTSENPVYVEMKTDGTYQALNGRPAGAPVAEKGTAQCGQQVGRHWKRQPCPSDNCEPAPAQEQQQKQPSRTSGKPSTTSSTSTTTEQPSTAASTSTAKPSTRTTNRKTATPAAKQQDPKPSATTVRPTGTVSKSVLLSSLQPNHQSTPVMTSTHRPQISGQPPVNSGPGVNWGPTAGAIGGVILFTTIAACLASARGKRGDKDLESGTQPGAPANPEQQTALLEIEAPEAPEIQQQGNQGRQSLLPGVHIESKPSRQSNMPPKHQFRYGGNGVNHR